MNILCNTVFLQIKPIMLWNTKAVKSPSSNFNLDEVRV